MSTRTVREGRPREVRALRPEAAARAARTARASGAIRFDQMTKILASVV